MNPIPKLFEDNLNIHFSKLTIKNLYDISKQHNININILVDMWNLTNPNFNLIQKVVQEYEKMVKNKKIVKKTLIEPESEEELFVAE